MGGCLSVQRDEPTFGERARDHHRRHVEEVQARARQPSSEDQELRRQAAMARRRARDEDIIEQQPEEPTRRPSFDASPDAMEPRRRYELPPDPDADALKASRERFERRQAEPDPHHWPDDKGVNLWGYKVSLPE